MSMTRDIAILVEDDYEDLELWYPYYRLKEAGWNPVIVGPGTKESYRSKHGYEAKVDRDALRADARSFHALIIPGGFAPDRLRRHHVVTELVKKVFDSGKVVASICHGPSVLISANVLRGRKVTCFFSFRDDVINAGAMYFDEEVVVDGNLITSRTPADLPAFMREVLIALG
jgi:protease I